MREKAIFRTLDDLLDRAIPEPNSGCWLWLGALKGKGYGHLQYQGRFVGAHQVSLLLSGRSIGDGLWVLHKCDTPSCVNPDHLFCGTPRDNIRDCMAKGRMRRGDFSGERNNSAKLSQADVDAIRSSDRSYGSGRKLADQYGVSERTISVIRCGKSWRKK